VCPKAFWAYLRTQANDAFAASSKDRPMTIITRSHEYTAPSTSVHIAPPTLGLHVPPGYGVRFGLAAVVLSLLGVPDSEWSGTLEERAAASQAVGHSGVARTSRATEWDEWKATRDLA
jgi:hypothetical protein